VSDEIVTSLPGPVEKVDGKLVLRIPLFAVGGGFTGCSSGISDREGDFLKVEIQEWLAGLLRIEERDRVTIHNTHGKFHIRPGTPGPDP
jgi:hypothetical protein